MKLQDKENLDIASAVSDVLEGKVKKEEFKPHMMYHPDNGKEVHVKSKEEHEKYAAKGWVHEKPKMESPEPPRKPSGKNGPHTGESEFAGKHKKKVSGMKNDGTNIKEEVTVTLEIGDEELDEAAKPGKGKTKLDIDYIGDRALTKKAEKKYKIKIKQTGRTTADVSGEKKNIVGFMKDPDIMGMDDMDLEDLYPELYEATKQEGYLDVEEGEELSPKQKKYQAFFKKALKKFGVESPAELDDKKKKEFFDYVDKNYDAGEGETD